MKRKAAALALCLLLVFQLTPTPASAENSVYFTAINDNILPLTDETMPFWSGGFLYVASSVFAGDVRKELDIAYIYPAANNLLILYGGGKSLQFDLTKSYALGSDGNSYYPPAVLRGDVVFVPASVVAEYFGLTYSVTSVDHGNLVWLRRLSSNSLPESVFADAARNRMAERYSRYLKSKEPVEAPETTLEIAPEESFEGKSIYLCTRADDPAAAAALLDALAQQNSQAAFFCTVDFLEQQGDLLRRMAATGQAIGMLADGSDAARPVAEQLRDGNAALALATCEKTRLVRLENGTEQAALELTRAGYCLLTPTMDRSGYGLKSASNADALLQRVTAKRGDVSVWLGESATASGLRAFLSAAKAADDRCQAVTELTA